MTRSDVRSWRGVAADAAVGVAGGVALAAAGGVARRRLADARVDDVPLGRYRAPPCGRVGEDFAARNGLVGERVVGEMDDLDAFARPDLDTGRVAPPVRDFYERTSEFRMSVAAEWHRPFRTGAALAAPLTSRIEQLDLPGPREPGRVRVVDSELFRVESSDAGAGGVDGDPRENARFWVRTDVESGEAAFVAVYGSHVDDGERVVNIAVPLPGATLSTVLAMRALDLAVRDDVGVQRRDDVGVQRRDDVGVSLTTRAPGHPGLFWSTPRGDWRLPMHQDFRVWPGDATPTDGTVPVVDVAGTLDAAGVELAAGDREDAVVATHEMWLLGRRFLTVRYVAFPKPDR